jgi:hypothetical protein
MQLTDLQSPLLNKINETNRSHSTSNGVLMEADDAKWRIAMSNSSNKGVTVVTGASSDTGAVYADRLAKRGYDLIWRPGMRRG